MKKGSILALGLLAVFLMAPNPPPPPDVYCSPGFYKNHVDTWWDICCDASIDECADLEDALNAHGKWMRPIRDGATDILNTCFAMMGYQPCEDD
jgi:hypothetical protein